MFADIVAMCTGAKMVVLFADMVVMFGDMVAMFGDMVAMFVDMVVMFADMVAMFSYMVAMFIDMVAMFAEMVAMCAGAKMVVLPALVHLHLPDGGPLRPTGPGHRLPLLQEGILNPI
jgi:hypothetical protein